jgi:DNA-binding response OmpR family regulator
MLGDPRKTPPSRKAPVFNGDVQSLQRLAPHVRRVMVIDPSVETAHLLADLVKNLGAREVVYGFRPDRLMEQVERVQPQVIITELAGPDYNGLVFTRDLRRSDLIARTAPVIMVTAEAMRETILAARNAGVHEFLKKPFSAGDLHRRIEHVALKPRPWVESKLYVGPDRRRFNSGQFAGVRKRRNDGHKTLAAVAG